MDSDHLLFSSDYLPSPYYVVGRYSMLHSNLFKKQRRVHFTLRPEAVASCDIKVVNLLGLAVFKLPLCDHATPCTIYTVRPFISLARFLQSEINHRCIIFDLIDLVIQVDLDSAEAHEGECPRDAAAFDACSDLRQDQDPIYSYGAGRYEYLKAIVEYANNLVKSYRADKSAYPIDSVNTLDEDYDFLQDLHDEIAISHRHGIILYSFTDDLSRMLVIFGKNSLVLEYLDALDTQQAPSESEDAADQKTGDAQCAYECDDGKAPRKRKITPARQFSEIELMFLQLHFSHKQERTYQKLVRMQGLLFQSTNSFIKCPMHGVHATEFSALPASLPALGDSKNVNDGHQEVHPVLPHTYPNSATELKLRNVNIRLHDELWSDVSYDDFEFTGARKKRRVRHKRGKETTGLLEDSSTNSDKEHEDSSDNNHPGAEDPHQRPRTP